MGAAVMILTELLPLIQAGIKAAPGIIQSIEEAITAIKAAHDGGRDLTDEEWAKVHATRDALKAQLTAPDANG